MEILDTSVKIKCLIEMALKGEISWLAIDPVKLTPTLEKARQIIKILLKEFETHQSICSLKTSIDDNDFYEHQSISGEVKINQRSFSEDAGIKLNEERKAGKQIRSEEMTNVDNDEQDFTNEVQAGSDPDFSEADSENDYRFHGTTKFTVSEI